MILRKRNKGMKSGQQTCIRRYERGGGTENP